MTLTRFGNALRGGWGLIAIAATLVGLGVVVVLGSVTTDRNATDARHAVLVTSGYRQAAAALAAEDSSHRSYWLQPGPVPLASHRAAQAQAQNALAQLRRLGDKDDQLLVTQVLAEQAQYKRGTDVLFAAVDANESDAAVAAIDVAQVEPVLRATEAQINTALNDYRVRSLRSVDKVARASDRALVLDFASLVAAVFLIAAAGRSLVRSQRRLQSQSDLNRHQSLHDSLTGLPNRDLFHDRVDQALKAATRNDVQVAVMVLDLDRFKDVNDTLGHHYGDLLLQQIATRFSATLRAGDSVARLGGDEFGVLLCDAGGDGGAAAAQRLTAALDEAFTVKDMSLDVEASIGIALAGPGADVATVLRHADVAMYEAKSQHLPVATYELTRDDNTVARLALLGDLRRAISAGEMVLHYQPKVSTTTGELHSVEALVRWQHPTRGLLAPGAFIPIAENTAVITPLTTEILRQALSQVRSWLDRGWAIPVAVNISARSLTDLTFPAQVERQLEAAAVPANLLSLELTESAIMADPGRALTILEALNALGVSLSIDDFGTGYSSMAYLKSLPVRELKIDSSFVIGMATDESDVVLAQSAVDLGHNLGLHVVAEGVEDAATQQALSAMGCDLVQGYHICRPIPAAALDPWLSTHPCAAPNTPDPAPSL